MAYGRKVINICVKSSEIIKSIVELNDINVYNDLCETHDIFVIYLGEIGYDASGLKKDFFSNCSIEFSKLLEECDGYLTIPNNIVITPDQIKYISLMLARSIFDENISPQIKLHPLLTYLLIYGGNNINFDKLHEYMSYFDIDFFNNIFKLLTLSDKDYEMFMDLQDDDINVLNRKKYILKTISDKYVHPKLIHFVCGFRIFFKSLYFANYVNPIVFHKYVCGNDNYEIISNTSHSLKNNLHVYGIEKKYVDIFKKCFLDILNNLNITCTTKLQSFLKYWFATSSIISFSDRSPCIYLTLNLDNGLNKYAYFYSSTCFDKLSIKISKKNLLNEFSIKDFIEEAIESSIENQKIWEINGIHMQLA
jgi:hypothetical protein